MANSARLPSLIAFDLDYTLWDLWVDTHVTGPLRRPGDSLNRVVDKYGYEISFYPDVPRILHEISGKTTLALCSRTDAPHMAQNALRLLLVPPAPDSPEPRPALEYFQQKEIYPGSKISHFKALHRKTGIPYSEMLFFDDERRNREVESLGVTFVLVSRGVNHQSFWDGVEQWRRKSADIEETSDSS